MRKFYYVLHSTTYGVESDYKATINACSFAISHTLDVK
jgi:hypothetical protein